MLTNPLTETKTGRHLDSMKPDQQRMAISKACGWTRFCTHEVNGATVHYGHPPNSTLRYERPLPDYLNDLNAMHEAEKRIVDWVAWRVNLSLVVGTGYCPDMDLCEDVRAFACATAAQRAEAFLKTLGLWEA